MVKGGTDNSLYKNILSVLQKYMASKPKGMLIYWLSFCVWIFRDPNFNNKFWFKVEFQLVFEDCALSYLKFKKGLVWFRHFQDINFASSMWEVYTLFTILVVNIFEAVANWVVWEIEHYTIFVGYLLVANIFLFKNSSLVIICKSILNTCMIY